jgi:hemerythrin-like metal-binding protein
VALVTWDESYSVKVAPCDEDHKKLFVLLNSVHDAMKAGKGAAMLQGVVQELLEYTKYHFAREEDLLEKTNFPGLAQQRAQHRQFEHKVDRFRQELKEGKMGQATEVVAFLKDWLNNHIKQVDRQYSAHLNSQGIS